MARSRCGNGSATKPPTPSATELSLAPAHGRAGPLSVGAEDGARTDAVLTCVLDVANRGLGDRLGEAVQANLQRSPANADTLTGPSVHVRSVKCAYVEAGGAHRTSRLRTSPMYAWPLPRRGRYARVDGHPHGRLREALLLELGPTIPIEQLLASARKSFGNRTGRRLRTTGHADERSGAELLRCGHLTRDSNLETQGNSTAERTKRPD